MKRVVLIGLVIIPSVVFSQDKPVSKKIGLKAGVNFSSNINNGTDDAFKSPGLLIGGFFSPGSTRKTRLLGFRTELLFHQQRRNFTSNTGKGDVNMYYVSLPQLTTINLSRFVQLEVGMQLSYLLHAEADSVSVSSGPNPYSALNNYYNRLNYGIAAGIELHPARRLLIGARYTIPLNDMYKQPASGPVPSFIPPRNAGNTQVQLVAGWIF